MIHIDLKVMGSKVKITGDPFVSAAACHPSTINISNTLFLKLSLPICLSVRLAVCVVTPKLFRIENVF